MLFRSSLRGLLSLPIVPWKGCEDLDVFSMTRKGQGGHRTLGGCVGAGDQRETEYTVINLSHHALGKSPEVNITVLYSRHLRNQSLRPIVSVFLFVFRESVPGRYYWHCLVPTVTSLPRY